VNVLYSHITYLRYKPEDLKDHRPEHVTLSKPYTGESASPIYNTIRLSCKEEQSKVRRHVSKQSLELEYHSRRNKHIYHPVGYLNSNKSTLFLP
jgi:hypothetical protein